MQSGIMLSVIMQSGVMLSVIVANVLAPTNANAVSYQAKKEVTSQSVFKKLAAFLKQFLFLMLQRSSLILIDWRWSGS